MVLMAMELPIVAIERQIASAIDIIVHVGRLRDKSRKVIEVAEILGYGNNEIQTNVLFQFQETAGKGDKILGEWKCLHQLQNTEKLLSAGYQCF
jgi:pilus assembly protein CpaF